MLRTICTFMLLVCVRAVSAQDATWHSEILLQTKHGMGGAAIGDLDPGAEGNEVVVVNGGGEVWMVRKGPSEWEPVQLYQGEGEMIMCAIGDVDPRFDGNEFVGVGMVTGPESRTGTGQVLVIHHDQNSWVATSIFHDDHMIHGVAVGDFSKRHDGNEIVIVGFNHRVRLLYFVENVWKQETLYVGNDRMKIVIAADVLPEHDGVEALVCGTDGRVLALWEGELGWHHELVFSDPIGQSRVAAGEGVVLVGGDGGKVTLCDKKDGYMWRSQFLMRDSGKIRGVVVADVDPAVPGSEYYACGYSKNVTQLNRDANGFWNLTKVFSDDRTLHHLVAGELDSQHEGVELITCGHSGRLTLLTCSR